MDFKCCRHSVRRSLSCDSYGDRNVRQVAVISDRRRQMLSALGLVLCRQYVTSGQQHGLFQQTLFQQLLKRDAHIL